MLTFTNTKKIGPTIALCVIAKNEADMIAECLDSVRPFVDEMVVVDTGSTDETVAIAEAHGARVVHFEWINDFAAARNFAIDSATADWILMLDADERLTPESGPFLSQAAARLPEHYFGFCVQIENRIGNRTMAHYMTRFFPRTANLRFEGRIHEELKPQSKDMPELVMLLPMVRLIHLGYEPAVYIARRKDERNMQLLEAELAQRPDDARLLYYIMQQHCAQGRYEKTLEYVDRFMTNKRQLRQAFTIEVIRMHIESLQMLGRWDEANTLVDSATRDGEVSSYSFEMVGNHELMRGRTAAALQRYMQARDESLPLGLWGRPTGEEWELVTKVADCHWDLGHQKRALAEIEGALTLVPENRRSALAVTVVQRCVQAHQYAAAYRWAARAHEFAGDRLEAHLEIVDLALSLPLRTARHGTYATFDRAVAKEDWQTVYDEARQMPLDNLAALARVIRVASRMTAEGAPEAALDLLERAMDAFPTEQLVYWNLARALNALDRHADAANALDVIAQLQSPSDVPAEQAA